ncbi:MAG: outer membrane protein OmpA-like peptidoglycan-associated protein [Myxococcota bacterium]
MRLSTLCVVALLAGCVQPSTIKQSLYSAEQTIRDTHLVYGKVCAPVELANAEASAAFTKVEFENGDLPRAREHALESVEWADLALAKAQPCGTADRDGDTVVDMLDQCPDEPEDLDGVDDSDGCRDIDPNGDEDGDAIRNIDDACMFDPEDYDQDADEDGCPETSLDRDGDGLIDAVDQCPDDPEDMDDFNDQDGCPDPDDDLDGIPDLRDHCRRIAEDLDGWDDDDGCPDPDNDADSIPDDDDECPNEPGDRELSGCPTNDADQDGIADENDRCPTQAEIPNGYLDDDGCPDAAPARVTVTRRRIEITDSILFETGRARLLAQSGPTIDDVSRVLNDVPSMRIRVEGHTDSQGGEQFNLELSQERARAVMFYLRAKGIATERLESEGYGETVPLDTNRTPEGRQRNRRVEFVILEQ